MTASTSPFERIGGHPVLRAITDHFYDLMERDPEFAALRAMHAPDLTEMRDQLPSFLAGWAGGPRDWFEANPGKCMMSAHRGIAITGETAQQWATAMTRAIADTDVADRTVGDALAELLARMAQSMGRA